MPSPNTYLYPTVHNPSSRLQVQLTLTTQKRLVYTGIVPNSIHHLTSAAAPKHCPLSCHLLVRCSLVTNTALGTVGRGHHNAVAEVAQYQREEAIDQKQAEGQVGKDVVGNDSSVAISVEGREHDQVLLRHDDHQTQEEADRE